MTKRFPDHEDSYSYDAVYSLWTCNTRAGVSCGNTVKGYGKSADKKKALREALSDLNTQVNKHWDDHKCK